MPDDLPGPSLGELRAASVNLLAAHLAAGMVPDALKAAVERDDYFCRAHTLGFDREAAERILAPIVEDRLAKGLPHYGPGVYRVAMDRIYAEISEADDA
jgi:hypothetical protein